MLHTLRGPISGEELGLILPHEHLFTDLRGPATSDYAKADPDHVVRVIGPYINQAQQNGVTALVECSTPGVGRNLLILQRLAESTTIHIIAPTGVYREGFIPHHLLDLEAEVLADIWINELIHGIEGSQIRAGFIKIALSDDGPRPIEVRSLKAAARASRETGAVIASHSTSWEVARRELALLEDEGLELSRFIWVHANLETNRSSHLEAAKRGAYVELDAVGAAWQDQERLLEDVLALIEAGYSSSILLSHDAGWYDPGQPDGHPVPEGIRGYTSLIDDFLPALKKKGVSESTIHQITHINPLRAFSFS
jgi:phosphotriesterase-related protein